MPSDAPDGEEDEEAGDADRIETSGDIASVGELDDQQQLDQVCYYFLLITSKYLFI